MSFLMENIAKIKGFQRFIQEVKGKKRRDLSIMFAPNSGYPVLYFRKPKAMTEEEFEVIMSNLLISIDLDKVKSDLELLNNKK
jgi:hypothetical protein